MHILLHFFEAMMEARAMSWGVLALTAGTLGKRLLAWNIKASGSCFCGFVWKTPSFCGHLLALPTLYALQVFTWLGHADWSGTYALCPVSISALGNDGIWKETLHLLYRLKHLGVWKVRYKWLSCINPLCFDENILFLIPLSKQVCIYVCVCVCAECQSAGEASLLPYVNHFSSSSLCLTAMWFSSWGSTQALNFQSGLHMLSEASGRQFSF